MDREVRVVLSLVHIQIRVIRACVLERRETLLFCILEQEPLEVLVCRCSVDLRASDPEEIPLVLLGCADTPEVPLLVVEVIDVDVIRVCPEDILEVVFCDHRDVHIWLAEPLVYCLVEECDIVPLLQVVPLLCKLPEACPQFPVQVSPEGLQGRSEVDHVGVVDPDLVSLPDKLANVMESRNKFYREIVRRKRLDYFLKPFRNHLQSRLFFALLCHLVVSPHHDAKVGNDPLHGRRGEHDGEAALSLAEERKCGDEFLALVDPEGKGRIPGMPPGNL